MHDPKVDESGSGEISEQAPSEKIEPEFYCTRCAEAVLDPLRCGDCASQICRKCGTPLERIDELGIG
jgi:hypothetical protein